MKIKTQMKITVKTRIVYITIPSYLCITALKKRGKYYYGDENKFIRCERNPKKHKNFSFRNKHYPK